MSIFKIKLYLIIITFLLPFLLLLCGCVPHTKEKNQILSNPHFIKFLQEQQLKIVAPSSGLTNEESKKLKEKTGCDIPQVYEHLLNSTLPFHANTDQKRFLELKRALYDPNIKVIWALGGGYGSGRLIFKLMKLPIPSTKKIFIGYSDTTALHLFFSQNWQWKTIHGAVFKELLKEYKNQDNFIKVMQLLSQQSTIISLNNLIPLNTAARRSYSISAPLTGGNLTLLQTSIGTPWQMQGKNKIIFIEDVGVKGGQVDRTLYHLKEVGLFKKAQAIIFGEFEYQALDSHNTFALSKFAEEINIPVFKTNEFGHYKDNVPLIYNQVAEIKKTKYDSTLQGQNFTLTMNIKL